MAGMLVSYDPLWRPSPPLPTQFITKYGYKTKTTNKNLLVVKLLRGRPALQCKYLKSEDYLLRPSWLGTGISYLYSNQNINNLRACIVTRLLMTGKNSVQKIRVFLPPNPIFAGDCKPNCSFYCSSLGLRPQGWDGWKCILSAECWFLPPEIDVCGWTGLTWCFVLLHSNMSIVLAGKN